MKTKNNPNGRKPVSHAGNSIFLRGIPPEERNAFKDWCKKHDVQMVHLLAELMTRIRDEQNVPRGWVNRVVSGAKERWFHNLPRFSKNLKLTASEMVDHYRGDMPIYRIAQEAECSPTLVYTILREQGVLK